jgi:3-oxoadipate enol-lactonase
MDLLLPFHIAAGGVTLGAGALALILQPRIRPRRIAAGIVVPVIAAAALAFADGSPAGLVAQSGSSVAAHGIAYDVTGDPDSPAIVLIHGFSLDRRMWDAQVAAVSDRARVVRYDLRGHGASAPAAEPYHGYDDLRALLDELGVPRATLVAHSAGAVVAVDFALVYPSRVEALVLAAPGVGGFRPPAMPWLDPVFEAVGAGDAARAAGLWAETPIMAVHADEATADAVRAMALDNAALWSMARLEQPLDPPALGRLEAIAAPTLVVVGDRDLPHILEIAGLLAARIPGAQQVIVPGAGHLVNLDAPAAFDRALARFHDLARPRPGIDRLAWLAGCWEGELASGTTYEEAWLAPRAGTMVGVARATRDGRALSFEYMRIFDDAGTPVFEAQPSGRPPTSFRARAVGVGRVTFENPAHDFPQRILYRLEPPDRLLARIEGERDGESRGIDFPLRRVACPGQGPPEAMDDAR